MSDHDVEAIDALLDPEHVEAQQRKRERYLRLRNLKLRIHLWIEDLRERSAPWLGLARFSSRSLLSAACLLVVLEGLAALLQSMGVLGAVDVVVAWATQWAVSTPTPVSGNQRLSFAALTIAVTGIALPIYYSIQSSILRDVYAEAPERVQSLFLNDPLKVAYRRSVVTMGVVGILVLALGGLGHTPSSVTIGGMTVLILVTIAGLFVVWSQLVSQADVTRLSGIVARRLRGVLGRLRAEIAGPQDPEALETFRSAFALQLSVLDDLARYAQDGPRVQAAGAHRLALGVAFVAREYGPLAAKIPPNSQWSSPSLDQVDVIQSGGSIPSYQESARVMPSPRTQSDPHWVERRLGGTGRRIIDISLREEQGTGVERVLEGLRHSVENLVSSRSLQGPLLFMEASSTALEGGFERYDVEPKVALVVHDRLGALHAPCIAALDRERPNFADAVRRLQKQPEEANPPPEGPGLKEAHADLQSALVNEKLIEGEVRTSPVAIEAKLVEAWEDERDQEALAVLERMRGFYVEMGRRLANRDHGPLVLAGVVQAYHMLGRFERAVGTETPRSSPFDRERWTLPEGSVRDAVLNLREALAALAIDVIATSTLERLDEKYPDTIGTSFYYTATEAITRLTQGPWDNTTTWLGQFLGGAFRVAGETGGRGGGPRQPSSPLQEAARVCGYVELWQRIRDGPPDSIAEEVWGELTAELWPDISDEERWNRLLTIATFPDRYDRPRYEQRFNTDLLVWDTLVELGLSNSAGSNKRGPPERAQSLGDPLVLAASVESDVLHRIDDYYWALATERLGHGRDNVPESVREAARNLERWGWP